MNTGMQPRSTRGGGAHSEKAENFQFYMNFEA